MTSTAVPVQRPGTLRRIAPALGLFFLAPLVGEYLLGNIPFEGLWGVPFLAPMYGGGALLIREVARRAGRGWPTILLLACAYGVLEAGLLDQSLFNPSFEGHDFQSAAHLPALGISAVSALSFVGGHAIWSIGVPIAIVETLVPGRRAIPWLGNVGLAVTAVVFLLGSFIIFDDLRETEQFMASAPQLAGAGAVTAGLIGVAFAIPRRLRPARARPAPNRWLVGAVAFVASSAFFAKPENWWGVAFGIGLLAVMTVVVTRWSGRGDWAAGHRLALAGGALLTYTWGGFVLLTIEGDASRVNLLGQSGLVLAAVALLVVAGRKARTPAAGDGAPGPPTTTGRFSPVPGPPPGRAPA